MTDMVEHDPLNDALFAIALDRAIEVCDLAYDAMREPLTPEKRRVYENMRDIAKKYNIVLVTAREPETSRVRRAASAYDDLTFSSTHR